MAFPEYTIRKATGKVTAEELQRLVTISVDAFSPTPWFPRISGYDVEFYAKYFEYFLIDSMLGAEVYLAEDVDTGAIVGYATWYAPGKWPFSTEEQQEKALKPILERDNASIREWLSEAFLHQYISLVRKAVGDDMSRAWSLHLMAVHPTFHRRGICRSLINEFIKQEIPQGGLLSVEAFTDLNAEIYERIEFTRKTENDCVQYQGEPFKIDVLTREIPQSTE